MYREVVALLDALGGISSEAIALGRDGSVVGEAETSAGTFVAFRYWDGRIHELLPRGAGSSRATSADESGCVVGYVNRDHDTTQAFRADAGGHEMLAHAKYDHSWASSVSSAGVLVNVSGNGRTQGALWTGAELRVLPTPGRRTAIADAMNSSALAVGSALNDGGVMQACAWHDGRYVAIRQSASEPSHLHAVSDTGLAVGAVGEWPVFEPCWCDLTANRPCLERAAAAASGFALAITGDCIAVYDPVGDRSFAWSYSNGSLVRLGLRSAPHHRVPFRVVGIGERGEVAGNLRIAGLWRAAILSGPDGQQGWG